MKNNLFHKATALVIGSLAVFSGQALALGSNHQIVTNADALNNSEIVIAQQDTVGACAQVEAVVQVLDQTITQVEQVEKNNRNTRTTRNPTRVQRPDSRLP